ncbi:MAG: O-antigen/teichoic acid export membrane protein [Candidatus Azotimanducaceae bacterium]|jgi:O-antigen/teichoic acid export membrane protein
MILDRLVKLKEELSQHAGIRRYASNTLWLLLERVYRLAVGLGVAVWVTRYLGPENFGLLSYVQSLVFMFSALATLGLDSIVIRELVKHEDQRDELLGTAFVLKLVGSIVMLLSLGVATMMLGETRYVALLIFVVGAAHLFQTVNVVDYYFQAKVLSKYVAISQAIGLALTSSLKIYLILIGADLFWFGVAISFDALVVAICLGYHYLTKAESWRLWRFSLDTAKRLMSDAWPLLLSAAAVSLYLKIDQIMIRNMLEVDSVGHYAAATRLTEALYFIPVVIAASVFPAVINARSDTVLFQQRLRRLYTLLVWMGVAIALPLALFAGELIQLLYGDPFAPSAGVLVIHAWSSVFVFLGVASSNYLIANNMTMISLYRALLGVIVNVLLNLVLIPQYGIAGAAFATLLAQFSSSLLYDVFDKRLRAIIRLKLQAFFPFYLLRAP